MKARVKMGRNGDNMLTKIEEAIEVLKQGRMIILVDDEHRENEGDLCMLAEHCTAADINFMAHYGCGLICLTMTSDRLKELNIEPQVAHNTSRFHTAFHVSIEAARGVTTGISAADRATTIRTAVSPTCRAEDLARPGHMFPISARPGGVLVRVGQTEGSVDLAKLCGSTVPAGVICEIMKEDGTMARMPDLEVFAQIHQMPIVTIADLIAYRLRSESLVRCIKTDVLQKGIAAGFTAHIFRSEIDGSRYLALSYGWDKDCGKTPLVRVHSGALWVDALALDDSGNSIVSVLERIRQNGCGVVLYIPRESTSLEEAIDANVKPEVDEEAVNRVPPELRFYGIGAQCLRALGITDMTLLTDSPKKMSALDGFGLHVVQTLSMTRP